jgi:hypothetical protein
MEPAALLACINPPLLPLLHTCRIMHACKSSALTSSLNAIKCTNGAGCSVAIRKIDMQGTSNVHNGGVG